jgi:hypothetical protein
VTVTLATAADARYGGWLLNMLGSVQRRSPLFDRIVAYDLGLTPFQRRLLAGVRGVEVRAVPPFVPHWQQGRTWKTWIWQHVEGDTIVWLDAGLTVLRPLTDFLQGADERGYFVVSQGVPLRDQTPSDYWARYGLDRSIAERVSLASGILAWRRDAPFHEDVIARTYEDAVAGLSVGFSEGELDKLNWGLDGLARPVVRDCPRFRWDQTIFDLNVYRAIPDPVVADLDRYAGYRSAHDDPQQVIWSHRRSGDLRFLPRVRYRPAVASLGLAWGIATWGRWTLGRYRWLFRPAPYLARLRRLARIKDP